MSYDRKDFLATLEKKSKAKEQQMAPAIRALQVVGSVMSTLTTQSGEWNRYLTFLQGQIDKTRALRQQAQEKLADPSIWEPYQMNKLKSDIIKADGMIAAWEFAMRLPKALVDGGAEATEFLLKLDNENDSQKPASQG